MGQFWTHLVGQFSTLIDTRTDGKYTLVKKEQETDVAAMQLVAEHLNNKLNNGDK